MIVTNGATALWTAMDTHAVVRAEQEIDRTIQWAWGADDLVWIVRGTAATEGFVHALLQRQAQDLHSFDQQGMTGDLYDHTPNVTGYTYWDLPRANTVAEINQTLVGDCAERFYLGYVLPDGAPDDGYDPTDLGLGLIQIAGRCIDGGS